MGVTDCHVHINPLWEMHPSARATISGHHADFARIEKFLKDPDEFVRYLDACGVDRALLINYVAPEVIGYTEKSNDFVLDYVRGHPSRLVAVGSVDPRHHPDPGRGVHELRRRGIRAIKLHPPHQLFDPGSYTRERGDQHGLRGLYEACQEDHLPIIVHTGTSIFPGARNRFAQPMLLEDVAIDFPDLVLVLAHGGRPFWTEEATFLARRFKNVYLEVSGVPPEKILHYFPDLERLREKALFGSDWPGPGVKDIKDNLERFRRCGLSEEAQTLLLETNPDKVFPRENRVG